VRGLRRFAPPIRLGSPLSGDVVDLTWADIPTHAHCTYAIAPAFPEAAEMWIVKIGITTNPRTRLRGIASCSPLELTIVRLIPGDSEAFNHVKFADARCHGEWFAFSDEIDDWLSGAFCLLHDSAGLI
jgi:hypothetical protein